MTHFMKKRDKDQLWNDWNSLWKEGIVHYCTITQLNTDLLQFVSVASTF